MLHAPAQSPPTLAPAEDGPPQRQPKRKAETQDNERLSKRLSLLNIEQDGSKVYVPVESPNSSPSEASRQPVAPGLSDDSMQMDDSKHKVYIYNLDDELSDEDSDVDQGKLVFLPDIEKHLKLNRIPRHIIERPDPDEEDMQVVLYSDPKSLSVPEESDSVRKAIIAARKRTRERQRLEREGIAAAVTDAAVGAGAQAEVPKEEAMELD